jgi:uncharacterized protein YprB with RNaseH-like and TPR domain
LKDDVRERLRRLNKGRLAEHLVRGRDLVDKQVQTGKSRADPENDPKVVPGEKGSRQRSPRKRLTEDMIRPAGASKAEPIQKEPERKSGLGALGRLRQRLKEPSSTKDIVRGPGATSQSPDPVTIPESWGILRAEIEAELLETPVGSCLLRKAALPIGEWVGSQQVPDSADVDLGIIAKLSRDERFVSLEPTDLLFLDTETTGLAGGTGTLAFLVGLGYWGKESFEVVQYFVPDYPEEMALLHLLEEKIGDLPSLVTYNGKAFDIPLLRSRFVQIRGGMGARLTEVPHLDLLHPSRRLWKRRLGNCSLTNLELEILGFEREDDVPGWEIPQIYFRFLSEGDVGQLPTVFLHNQYDLISLAQLAVRACQLYREPLGDRSLPGTDLYSLARSLEIDGIPGAALEVLEEARLVSLESDTRRNVLRHLSRVYKRQKNWEAAVAIWQELGESDGVLEVFSFEEMAKFYEHVARDLRLAAAVTSRILEALTGNACVDPTPYQDLDSVKTSFKYRLQRIERKLSRQKNREDHSG